MFKQSMTMAQQRITILRILEEGKKSVDEATELLEATNSPRSQTNPATTKHRGRRQVS